jgi:hypothetical protein
LVACPNFDHRIHFSPSPGKIQDQADGSHEDSVKKKKISCQNIEQNSQDKAKMKMPIHPSSFYNQSFTPKLVMLFQYLYYSVNLFLLHKHKHT